MPGPLRDLHLHPRPNATSADLGDLARSVRPSWERSGPKLESKTVLKIMNARLKRSGRRVTTSLDRSLWGIEGRTLKTASFSFLFKFLRLRWRFVQERSAASERKSSLPHRRYYCCCLLFLLLRNQITETNGIGFRFPTCFVGKIRFQTF